MFTTPTYRYLANKWLKPQEKRMRKERFEAMSLAAREQFTDRELRKISDTAFEIGRQKGIKEIYKSTYGEGFRNGFKEGIPAGRMQERQLWLVRERRRVEAEAKGIPFNEPFPGDDEVDADN